MCQTLWLKLNFNDILVGSRTRSLPWLFNLTRAILPGVKLRLLWSIVVSLLRQLNIYIPNIRKIRFFLKIKKKRYNLDEIRRLLSCLDIEPDASFWYWHSLLQSFLWHAISIVPYRTSCLLPILVFILAERGVKSCQSLKRNSRGLAGFQAQKKGVKA